MRDHAGNSEAQNRRRSQNGLLVTYNGCPVMWQSKASSVAFASPHIGEAHADMSSGAVEIYTAGNATLDILALSHVVDEMGIDFPRPFILELDNDAANVFIKGTAQRSKLKHIDARQEWVKTLRDRSVCSPVHIDTADNLADFFTKPLEGKLFFDMRDRIMNVAPSAMGGLARSYRARVHGGVSDTAPGVCSDVWRSVTSYLSAPSEGHQPGTMSLARGP